MSAAAPGTESLLLVILSVLLTLGFVTALIVALFLVRTVLESVRGSLEKIALGVRAIERQVEPLGRAVPEAGPSIEDTARAVSAMADRLERSGPAVADALVSLRRR